jgi:hypothetical protein
LASELCELLTPSRYIFILLLSPIVIYLQNQTFFTKNLDQAHIPFQAWFFHW